MEGKFSTTKKDFWPALSSNSLYLFIIFGLNVIAALEISYYSPIIAIVGSCLASSCKGLFDKVFWNFWKDLSKITHKGVSFICLFWFVYLLQYFIPFLKEKYVEKPEN